MGTVLKDLSDCHTKTIIKIPTRTFYNGIDICYIDEYPSYHIQGDQ